MELLDQDVRRDYEDKCRLETAKREKADTERQAAEAAAQDQWQRELADGLRREIEDALATLANQTVTMATLMATKLVRREVAADPEVLVRTLETVLYKAEAGSSLSITAHPEDATWLEAAPELCERLRIREIKADRRLERGGCFVRADDLEWDATVERQLAVLGEALDEALAVPPEQDIEADAVPRPEDQDA
jgi:flagellar biosynthesis/type III secretory pathway protein FliH